MDFGQYEPSEQYKCGAFLQGRAEDKTLGYYYSVVDQLVAWLSNPFPHQDLLNKNALRLNYGEIQNSIETKYAQWFDWQKGWIILAGSILILSVIFPFFYLLYRLCACCCSSSSKKQTTDTRFDSCRRNIFNAILAVLVLLDVFAAAALLITGQYAEYGLEELPNRLNHCVDDLNLYKRDTDMRIRKLLIDDYQTLNRTVTYQLAHAGHDVVERVKRLTGAHSVDVFLNISNNARELKSVVSDVREHMRALAEETTRFEVDFSRLRKTTTEDLMECVNSEIDPLKAMCHKAERLLESIQVTRLRKDTDVLPAETDVALQTIIDADIPKLLGGANLQFTVIENLLQNEIDDKVYSAHNMLKQIGDDLFVVAETISTQIRQVNFDSLYNIIATVADAKRSNVMKYVHYSWYVSLALTSMFVLMSFCFLFGIFYGICGRRPTFYNDDCCVRSTGSRFFSCGIFLTILLFTVLCACTAILLFVVGNSSNLICQPLRDPLSRPDIMSLAERYVDLWKAEEGSKSEIRNVLDQRTPADVIRACQRNETFYEIFEFDKKYHLNDLKDFEKESYSQLERFLSTTLAELPSFKPFESIISEDDLGKLKSLNDVDVKPINKDGLEGIKAAITELDLLSKVKSFEMLIDNSSGRPKAVTSVLEQIEEMDVQRARPLRLRLESLQRNLTKLDAKLTEMQVPVPSLLSKLQHANSLLSEDVKQYFVKAAREQLDQILGNINVYIDHVKYEMQHEVSSCAAVKEIALSSTAAVCAHTVDPLNGTWMSMLICLLLSVPIVLLATALKNLYEKMHSFPKYIVEAPQDHHPMSSFITDTYDTRMKPGYSNYSYTDDYHRTYR